MQPVKNGNLSLKVLWSFKQKCISEYEWYLVVIDSNIQFYNDNAQAFFDATVGVDLAPLYQRFMRHIVKSGHILDAGCGSGRDAAFFHAQGYRVTAFDASPKLAELAATYCGLPVQVLRFEDIVWCHEFDAIWACASLLHIPPQQLPEIMRRLHTALKPEGILYLSFKYGRGQHINNERYFNHLDELGLTQMLSNVPCFTQIDTWITTDQRPERRSEHWLNSILKAQGGLTSASI